MTNEEIVLKIRANDNVNDNLGVLYAQNFPLIRTIAARYAGPEELEDLLQESYFGLVKAVELWDPKKDILFMSYATYWIKSVLTRYLQDHSTPIRVPSYQRDMIRRYSQMVNGYRMRFARDPEELEICHALGLSSEQYRQLLKDIQTARTCSTSTPIGEDGETILEDMLPDESDPIGDVIDRIAKDEEAAALWAEVDRLPDREAEVIRSRFRDNLTLKQCGEALGVSPEMVRQIQAQAIRKLRRPKVQRRLSPYLTDSGARTMGLKGTTRGTFARLGSSQEIAMMRLERLAGVSLWGATLRRNTEEKFS